MSNCVAFISHFLCGRGHVALRAERNDMLALGFLHLLSGYPLLYPELRRFWSH